MSNRQTDNQRTHSTVNKKKVNGLRGSTPKQHTINLAPRAFSWCGKGKGPGTKVEHTVMYVLGQYSKRYRASFILQVNVKNILKKDA